MTHVRQQIREAAAAIVSPLVSGNVRMTRRYPHAEDDLPAASIFSDGEIIERGDMGGGLDRQLALKIRFVARQNDTLEDTLDQLSANLEAAWDKNLAGVDDSSLVEVEFELAPDGNADIGGITLEYQVLYHTQENNAEAVI